MSTLGLPNTLTYQSSLAINTASQTTGTVNSVINVSTSGTIPVPMIQYLSISGDNNLSGTILINSVNTNTSGNLYYGPTFWNTTDSIIYEPGLIFVITNTNEEGSINVTYTNGADPIIINVADRPFAFMATALGGVALSGTPGFIPMFNPMDYI